MSRAARIIDGRAVAKALRAAIKGDVEVLTTKYGRVCASLVDPIGCFHRYIRREDDALVGSAP